MSVGMSSVGVLVCLHGVGIIWGTFIINSNHVQGSGDGVCRLQLQDFYLILCVGLICV